MCFGRTKPNSLIKSTTTSHLALTRIVIAGHQRATKRIISHTEAGCSPGMKRVGVVHNPNNPNVTMQLRETEDAARKLNLQVQVIEARTSEDFERAFSRLSTERVNGVVLLADSSLIEQSRRIAELAQATRLLTAFQRRENVDAGGLLSYGPSINDQFREAGIYVDRILKGAKPSELPVEQPTKFEFVINVRTARALGLEVPPQLLARADEVIE
jgi:putative tryptophan/tyrosine transport system substrate-binding protein